MIEKIIPQFGELSEKLTKKLKTNIKKKEGIFFTPYNIIKKSIDLVIEYCTENNITINDILEPSCGSCEFIKYINNIYTNINIDGIEYNDDIYNEIEKINFGNNNSVEIINEDYLEYDKNNEMKYDLIIGNPPYFVISKKDIDIKYDTIYDGRPNIYLIFNRLTKKT
jgi:type I restriction-modification system DNA methylase subunit